MILCARDAKYSPADWTRDVSDQQKKKRKEKNKHCTLVVIWLSSVVVQRHDQLSSGRRKFTRREGNPIVLNDQHLMPTHFHSFTRLCECAMSYNAFFFYLGCVSLLSLVLILDRPIDSNLGSGLSLFLLKHISLASFSCIFQCWPCDTVPQWNEKGVDVMQQPLLQR